MGKKRLTDLVRQLNADNAPPDGWRPQDQVAAAPKKRRKKKKSLIEQMNDYYGCEYIVDGSKLEEDKPEAGKVYALTGGPGARCIANGNSWKESEVKEPAAEAAAGKDR